jgi:periplasmic copper chaperone A
MRIVNSNSLHIIASALMFLIILVGSAKAADVTVSDAWIRALPAGVPAGGYFTFHNGSGKLISLTGASSPACGTMMLHQTESTGGMSGMGGMGAMTSMVDVAKVDIPAGSTIKFSPGGYHLMCTNPTKAIQPGRNVPVTLILSDGTNVDSIFAVHDATGK